MADLHRSPLVHGERPTDSPSSAVPPDSIHIPALQVPSRSGPSVVVYPAYAISLVTWAIFGFLFWIPLLTRITAAVSAAIVASAFGNSDARHVTISFERAATFYSRGFEMIHRVFFPSSYRLAGPLTHPSSSKWETIASDLLWTCVFWGTFAFGWWRVLAPDPAITSIGAKVAAVEIWEGPSMKYTPSAFSREAFDSTSAGYVSTRITFRHPAVQEQAAIPVGCRYTGPSEEITNFPMETTYSPLTGETEGVVQLGVGYRSAGHWQKGEYKVECAAEGNTFLRRSFTIQ